MAGARDWLESDSPRELLKYARKYPAPNLDRALKFFALRCCHLIAPALVHPQSRAAVAVAERHLAGLAGADEMAAALLDASNAAVVARGQYEVYANDPSTSTDRVGGAERMSNSLGAHVAFHAAGAGFYDGLLAHVRDALAFRGLLRGAAGVDAFRAGLCRIMRELLANPFRHPVLLPEWRTDTALQLACQMVTANEFSAAPILADALQDADCDDDDILNHLRDPHAAHVRGCWALELLLASA